MGHFTLTSPMNSTALAPLSLGSTTIQKLSIHSTTLSPWLIYSTALPPLTINFTDPEHNTSPEYYDYEEISYYTLSALHIVSILLYSIGFLLGVTGNGLVIWITGFKMKKTVNTVWFLNLAIADFIFTFFLPLSIAYIALGFHWPFGIWLCKMNSTVAFLNMFASVFFLMVISVDRCISVMKPVWSQNHRTVRLASLIALGVWASALIISLPYFIFRTTNSPEINETTINCYNDFGSFDLYDQSGVSHWLRRYTAVISARFVIGFLLPFAVIIACYSTIALRLNRNHLATSSKPFKIIIAVIVCFFFCWFPYHIFSFLELSTLTRRREQGAVLIIGIPIASSLAFLNSCVNPILYVFMGRDFKEKLRMSIVAVFENAFNEETTETIVNTVSKSKSTSMVESQLV